MNQSPEEFILQHVYDPVKAHEYYLRTRDLKGRKKAAPKVTASVTSKRVTTFKPVKTSAQKQKEAKARVDALKAKLDKLQKALAKLVDQVQGRSGVQAEQTTKDTGKPKKQSAKQKADAKKRAKEYYEKNKDKSLSQQAKDLEAKIKKVEAQIKILKARLAAKKKKTGSVRASKSTAYK